MKFSNNPTPVGTFHTAAKPQNKRCPKLLSVAAITCVVTVRRNLPTSTIALKRHCEQMSELTIPNSHLLRLFLNPALIDPSFAHLEQLLSWPNAGN